MVKSYLFIKIIEQAIGIIYRKVSINLIYAVLSLPKRGGGRRRFVEGSEEMWREVSDLYIYIYI